jgi:hypothetical protein
MQPACTPHQDFLPPLSNSLHPPPPPREHWSAPPHACRPTKPCATSCAAHAATSQQLPRMPSWGRRQAQAQRGPRGPSWGLAGPWGTARAAPWTPTHRTQGIRCALRGAGAGTGPGQALTLPTHSAHSLCWLRVRVCFLGGVFSGRGTPCLPCQRCPSAHSPSVRPALLARLQGRAAFEAAGGQPPAAGGAEDGDMEGLEDGADPMND